MAESVGYLANLCVDSVLPMDASSIGLKYISSTLKEIIPIEQNDSIRCTRARFDTDVATGNVAVAGTLVFEPNPIELDALLYYMGFTVSTITWTLDEAVRDMYIQLDMQGSGTNLHTFLVRVTKWTLSGEPGKRIKLSLDVVGKTITIASGSFASTAINSVSRPYMFYDFGSLVKFATVAVDVDKFELSCDHKIEPTYMVGSTATDLEPTDRVIQCKVQTKYNAAAETTLLTAVRAGTSVAGSFILTNGAMSCTMTTVAMKGNSETPDVAGKTAKIRLPITYDCYANGATKELVIINDSAP